jgi:two-component system chemotaxis response regulator CheY
MPRDNKMTNPGDRGQQVLAECRVYLDALETCLPALRSGGAEIGEEATDSACQAAHVLKEGADFFGLADLRELAKQTEDTLELIRFRNLRPTFDVVAVLLRATDRLRDLIRQPHVTSQPDIAQIVAAFASLRAAARIMRVLLVDDDFGCRLMLRTFLSRYGECDVAVNGNEAVEAFRLASEAGRDYDLVCMDVMMPEMDGREAVRQIRAYEEARSILAPRRTKIIMTSAVGTISESGRPFDELYDACITKPIDLGRLLRQIKSYQLVP